MGRYLTAISIFMCVAAAFLSVAPGHAAQSERIPSSAISITDGDTFRIGAERVRILGIDTPEMGSGAECASERRRAEAATRRLRELLGSGVIELDRDGQDPRWRRRRIAQRFLFELAPHTGSCQIEAFSICVELGMTLN